MKQKRHTITLRNYHGDEIGQVSATIIGCYGVHKHATNKKLWGVSHLGCGVMVRGVQSRIVAIRLAEKLSDTFGDITREIVFEDGRLCYDRQLLDSMYQIVKDYV